MSGVVDEAVETNGQADLRTDVATAEAAIASFRADVRAEIMRQHYEGSWCLRGTQGALRDLDLPPIAMAYSGDAVVRVRIYRVKDASSYDEARDRVIRALGATSSDDGIEFELDYVSPDLQQREVRED